MLNFLEKNLPKIVLAPTTIVMVICMYGFIVWTGLLSLTKSRMMPQWDFVGLDQYRRLFANPRWDVAVDNLFIFLILFIVIALVLGLLLAIFLDQKIRARRRYKNYLLIPNGDLFYCHRYRMEVDPQSLA